MTPKGTPTDFFVLHAGDGGDYTGAALHFEVNPDLVADPSRVAASSVNGEVGNNKVAMAWQTSNAPPPSWTATTMEPSTPEPSATITEVDDEDRAEALTTYSQETASGEVLVGLKNRRDEVSGVSLDEESSSLIQYEKAYQAMARFMNVISDMTDILVNLGS